MTGTRQMATKAIVGEKVGMTQVWGDDNRVIPVTVLKVAPARIVQVKTNERDGYAALQVTYGRKDGRKLTKPEAGHFTRAGVEPGTNLVELRLDDVDGFTVGQEITADVLAKGQRVDVTALSRGKGWTGAMKRHNFSGQGASHGSHKMHRSPGSIGACSFPGRVFKGTKMAGRSGGHQVTTLNLEVVDADAERNLVLVRGAIPGPRGGVALGPKPRNYAQRTPKKMIRLALHSALSDRAAQGKVIVVDRWTFSGPKTRDAKAALAALGAEGGAMVVVDRDDENAILSF